MAFANIDNLAKKENIDALYRIAKRRRDKDAPAAMQALKAIGTTQAAQALLKLCGHNDIEVWQAARDALSGIANPLSIPALKQAIASGGHQEAVAALHALGSIDSIEALETLISALANEQLAAEALQVLRGRREPAVAKALVELMERRLEAESDPEQNSRQLMWSQSLVREIIEMLGAMDTVLAMQALHLFLRNRENVPQRLRLQAAREILNLGRDGHRIMAGYIGENLGDENRLCLYIQSEPDEDAIDTLLQNMPGKAADELGATLIACLAKLDKTSWPPVIHILERLNRDSIRSALLLWFIQQKASSREAGFMLARHGDTNPVLVKRLVDMVHKEGAEIRMRAGSLLKDLYADKLIGEEGVLLIKAQLSSDGDAEDYTYIGPDI